MRMSSLILTSVFARALSIVSWKLRCDCTYFLNPRRRHNAGGSPFIGNRVGEVFPVRCAKGRRTLLKVVKCELSSLALHGIGYKKEYSSKIGRF